MSGVPLPNLDAARDFMEFIGLQHRAAREEFTFCARRRNPYGPRPFDSFHTGCDDPMDFDMVSSSTAKILTHMGGYAEGGAEIRIVVNAGGFKDQHIKVVRAAFVDIGEREYPHDAPVKPDALITSLGRTVAIWRVESTVLQDHRTLQALLTAYFDVTVDTDLAGHVPLPGFPCAGGSELNQFKAVNDTTHRSPRHATEELLRVFKKANGALA